MDSVRQRWGTRDPRFTIFDKGWIPVSRGIAFPLSVIALSRIIIGLSFLPLASSLMADNPSEQPALAVFYPKVREPFDQVFLEIVSGIREQASHEIKLLRLDTKDNNQDLDQWLSKAHPDRLIALGRGGLKAAAALEPDAPVIIGAVTSPQSMPAAFSSILLTPDPEISFQKLKAIAPHIREVSIIYHPSQKDWLIPAAKHAADKAGLALSTLEAKSVKEAAEAYKSLPAPDSHALCHMDNLLKSWTEPFLPRFWTPPGDENWWFFPTSPPM